MSEVQLTPSEPKHQNRNCAFPGCERKHYGKGLCNAHWQQQCKGHLLSPLNSTRRPNGTPPVINYHEVPCPRLDLKGPCHVFIGCKSRGYGCVSSNGKKVGVHCYIWERDVGPIPDGMEIDHQCHVRGCCNVNHLRLVTRQVNSTENVVGHTWQKNIAKTHCPQGHEYNQENTLVHKQRRHCRKCSRAASRRWSLKTRTSRLPRATGFEERA